MFVCLGRGYEILSRGFLKGTIYWESEVFESQYFDVENECLKPLTSEVHRQGYRWFGECGGYLNLVVALVPSLLEYSVFEMAEDHSHLHSKYSLNLEADPYRILKMKRMVFKLLCVTHSEEEGDSMFIVDEDGTGISYNFKNNTRKDVRCTILTISSSSIQEYSLRCSLYFETLCCM
ncbi:hypothetical protein PVK06_040349 [Gossypium arboreum]|uniref:Uncharacterized protein n=1 Tax=Gossypium arboreum TaxID=29729 RepID=A0ABR0N5A8_GOSAR|nr:hypothetical protein PVK06_040349 [Gossypium arboreum]